MTADDVNVTELVARAINAEVNYATFVPYEAAQDAATAVLAALRSPEVVAGIAGVLAGSLNVAGPLGHIFGRETGDAAEVLVAQESEVAARAVVEWLAGGAR